MTMLPESRALLLTDIEGSTRLLEKAPASYTAALRQHHAIIRAITGTEGGEEFQDAGDGFFLAFSRPESAARAARAMQKAMEEADWPEETGALRVRMALHWAPVEFREGQYRGAALHLAARLLAAGHGGQVLCSHAAAETLKGDLPMRRLGTYRLRGFQTSEEIFQLEDDRQFPALRMEKARKHNLPAGADAIIGRERDLSRLACALQPTAEDADVMILRGPGGIGKTKLALAVAHSLLDAYDHAVLYVSLADARYASEISHGLVTAMGLSMENRANAFEVVVDALADTPALMVLDSFEHIAAEGEVALSRLRNALPLARWLLTSRVGLSVERAIVWPVFPLEVPEAGSPPDIIGQAGSVRLFLTRGRGAHGDLLLDERNAESVAEICRLLEGLPLALELAAARLQVLSVAELADALRRDLAEADGTGALEGVFRWSCGLLPPGIAEFLGALSAFREGCTALSAAYIGGLDRIPLALAYLQYLLTCSLVNAVESEGRMRFVMLEPIRQMAERAFPESLEHAVVRHGEFFRKLAQRVDDECETERHEAMVRDVRPEAANIVEALVREPDNRLRLFAAANFAHLAMHLACNETVRRVLAELRPGGGVVDPRTRARAWNAAAGLDGAAGRTGQMETAFRKALDLFQQVGDEEGAISVKVNLAGVNLNQPREETFAAYGEALAFFRRRGTPFACATILSNLALENFRLGQCEEALANLHECFALCDEHELLGNRIHALDVLGLVRLKQGDLSAAIRAQAENLMLQRRLGQDSRMASTLVEFALIMRALEDWPRAVYFCAASRATFRKYQCIPHLVDRDKLASTEDACRENVDEDLFERESARGGVSCYLDWLAEIPSFLTSTQTHKS